MYKVCIVDDNPIICKALQSRIPWQELGLELTAICHDGSEVLELAAAASPHIIITDIRMPITDGLMMIEQLRFRQVPIQFIIISGFDDFLYLKKAIDFEVIGYLMKPIRDEELLEYLHKAVANLQRQERLQQMSRSVVKLERRERVRIDSYCLSSLLRGSRTNTAAISRLEPLRFPPPYQWILFQLPMDGAYKLREWDADKLLLYEEQVNTEFQCAFYLPAKTLLAVVIQGTSPDIAVSCAELIFRLFKQDDISSRHTISKRCHDISELQEELVNAVAALYGSLFNTKFVRSSEHDRLSPSSEEQQNMRMLLSLMDYGGALNFIMTKLDRFMHTEPTPNALDFFVRSFVQLYSEYIHWFREIQDSMNSTLLPSLGFSSLEEFKGLFNTTNHLDIGNETSKIKSIIQFIDQNYSQPLTLTDLGRRFHHNSVYLGQLLKRETGMTFNHYLNKVRIGHAVEIIRSSKHVKLADLALQLGFSDSKYFSKVFKKVTGLTPSQLQ
jgi:two-component system response regulator YesN